MELKATIADLARMNTLAKDLCVITGKLIDEIRQNPEYCYHSHPYWTGWDKLEWAKEELEFYLRFPDDSEIKPEKVINSGWILYRLIVICLKWYRADGLGETELNEWVDFLASNPANAAEIIRTYARSDRGSAEFVLGLRTGKNTPGI